MQYLRAGPHILSPRTQPPTQLQIEESQPTDQNDQVNGASDYLEYCDEEDDQYYDEDILVSEIERDEEDQVIFQTVLVKQDGAFRVVKLSGIIEPQI